VSTASKARIDTAYQRLREHLAYVGLATASEELAPALERARSLKLSAVEVLEDLMAKEAEATSLGSPPLRPATAPTSPPPPTW